MTRLVRVARKWQEAERVFGFELEDPSGELMHSFEPGAHIDVRVTSSIIRQYSLCDLPCAQGRYRIAVQREINSRGGSERLCESVNEGDMLEISAPRNHFPLLPADSSVLLAGGIGITPLICMAEHLARSGAAFELHYCTQTQKRTAFQNRIAVARYRSSTFVHLDDGDVSQKLDLDVVLRDVRHGRHAYVCGPAGFLNYVRERARQLGWAAENVHFEYFAPPAADNSESTRSFEVVSARSGRSVIVGNEESVIDGLARIGIDIPRSCEVGVCGTCVTRVISGVPDHRDCFLSDAERAANDQFLPCCSRSKSARMVLDI